jgi:nucleoside phosphorylase
MSTILLVTITKTETQAVLENVLKATDRPWQRKHIGKKTFYDLGKIGGAEVFLVQSEMGVSTPGGALITIHEAIEALSPIAIIMVGIAFGTRPHKQQLGDILVAKQIMAYEPGKERGRFIPRGDRVTCSTVLLDKFRSGELDWLGASVHFGLVLSGEKLVNDLAFRTRLLEIEPEAIGGEMEGVGLYTAAQDAKLDWILVKAICDWADGNKTDDAQALAANNAAAFLMHVLKQGGWEGLVENGSIPQQKTPGAKIQQPAGNNVPQIGPARGENIHTRPVYNIQGGVHAGRDTILGDQTNITYFIENIQSAGEFVTALAALQAQITVLMQQVDLNNAQHRALETALFSITQAAAEAQKPKPERSQVKQTLTEAKETLEMLSGSVKAAVGLGGVLAGLIGLVSKLFGG